MQRTGRGRRVVVWALAGFLAAMGWTCYSDIVYVGTLGSGLALYVVDEATGATRLVTAGPVDTAPAWSPDGTRIAFVRWVGDAPDIFVVGADGADLVRLTVNPGPDFAPSWSPDGSTIAYLSERDGVLAAYLMDADGQNQRPFAGLPEGIGALDWSPDGASVAFDRVVDYEHHVFVLEILSGTVHQLVESPSSDPCWSADGSWIAFADDANIGIARPDGTGLRWVTSQAGRSSHPTWSPDGTRIAYQTDDLERNTICVVSVATGTYFRVADLGTWPDWSPR